MAFVPIYVPPYPFLAECLICKANGITARFDSIINAELHAEIVHPEEYAKAIADAEQEDEL